MKFEWDPYKNAENVRKHGVDFATVPAMFDFYMLVRRDGREDYGEERWIGVGMAGARCVVVAFVERRPDVIRVISARKAT